KVVQRMCERALDEAAEAVRGPGRAIDTIGPSDIHVHVGRTLAEWQEPGAAELAELAEDLVRERGNAPAIRLDRLKRAVYRLRFGSDLSRSLILKRHKHAIAAADRLLAE